MTKKKQRQEQKNRGKKTTKTKCSVVTLTPPVSIQPLVGFSRSSRLPLTTFDRQEER